MTGASHVTLNDRPTRPSTALAVVLASLPLVLLVGAAATVPLAVAWTGVALVALGGALVGSGRAIGGGALAVTGLLTGLAAVAFAATSAGRFVQLLRLGPGVLGVLTVGVALTWRRLRWRRGLVKAGAGLVFVVVLVSGIVPETEVWPLLWAAAAVVLAWDVAENAISVGEHLGRDASTWRAEFGHAAPGGLFGVVSVGLVHLTAGADLASLSLPALVLVLLGVVFLIAALHE
jgi:hypothetical protein